MLLSFLSRIGFIITALFIYGSSLAQTTKVEYITLSVVRNDTIVQHLDTFWLFYSNSRGGVALPYQNKSFLDQPLFFDSAIQRTPGAHYKFEKLYNTNGLVDMISQYTTWGAFMSDTRYIYNTNNQLVSTTHNFQNNTIVKDSNVYNSNGQLISTIRYSWSKSLTTFVPNYRYEYTYNGTALTDIECQMWDKTTSSYYLFEWTHNFYTSPLPDSTYFYRHSQNKTRLEKSYFTYNGTLARVIEKHKYFDTSINQFTKERTSITYSSNNEPEELITEEWDGNTNSWKKFSMYEYSYNSQGDIDTIMHSGYNNGTLVSNEREIFYYNANHLFRYRVGNQRYENGQWVRNNPNTPTALDDTTYVYHYDPNSFPPTTAGITKLVSQIKIYPNPASSVIYLELYNDISDKTEVTIYDLNGKIMRIATIPKSHSNNSTPVPIADLPTGNYLLHVSAGNQSDVKRFSILR